MTSIARLPSSTATALLRARASTIRATMPTAATPPTHHRRSTSSTTTRISSTGSNSMATATSNTSKAMVSNQANTVNLAPQEALQMASAV
jgi:hypothetical protein